MKLTKILIVGLLLTLGSTVAFNLILKWPPLNQPISIVEIHYYGWPLYWLSVLPISATPFYIHFAGLIADYALWTLLAFLVVRGVRR